MSLNLHIIPLNIIIVSKSLVFRYEHISALEEQQVTQYIQPV